MKIWNIPLRHATRGCGGYILVSDIRLDEERDLVICGHCAACGEQAVIVIPLDFLNEVFPRVVQDGPIVPPIAPKEPNEDKKFLKDIGIDPDITPSGE